MLNNSKKIWKDLSLSLTQIKLNNKMLQTHNFYIKKHIRRNKISMIF
jgi:hypothetical protein